jgi:hypothetical protein
VAHLFDGVREDGSHVVLDLGLASPAHLELYGHFSRRIRFAGLVPEPPHGAGWRSALEERVPRRDAPYDLILLWDALDRLAPTEREQLLAHVAEVTSPGARLYAVVEAAEDGTTTPLRFTLEALDRVVQRPVGPACPARPPLLPAEVERLLEPFEILRAFTLRTGVREYVAVRR